MAITQGFLASLEIDGIDITQVTITTPLTRNKNPLSKKTMDNTPDDVSIPGVESGDLSVTGLIDSDQLNALEVTWAKTDPVPFKLAVVTGDTTEPQWDGLLTLTSFMVDPKEDGDWEFSLSGSTSGAVTYVPSVA